MQARRGLIWLLGLAIVPSMAAQGKLSMGPVMTETFKYDLTNIQEGNFHEYPGLMSSNTTFLLEQAENMLSRVKVYKERLWLQAFLLKMRQLATNVKQSTVGKKDSSDKEHNNIQKKNDVKGGHEEQSIIQKKNDGSGGHEEQSISQKKNNASGDPEEKFKEKEESIDKNSSVIESTQHKFESIIRSIEENPATTTNQPEISHLTSNLQSTVTEEPKTVKMHQELMSTPSHHKAGGELVWELGELPRLAALARRRRKAVKPNFLMAAYEAADEMEKRKIERELGKEILELKQKGSSPYEIELALRLDEPMTVKLLRPYIHRLKMKKHGHSVKKTIAYQRKRQPSSNTSLKKKQINLFPVKEHTEQKHPRLQNILRKLQRENFFLKQSLNAFRSGNFNSGFKNRISESSNLYPSTPFNTHFIHTSKNAEFDEMKNESTPYNSDFFLQRGSSTNKNDEFSEEMKKELNNGKVILLSHSVVPSNFETEHVVPTKSDIKKEVQN